MAEHDPDGQSKADKSLQKITRIDKAKFLTNEVKNGIQNVIHGKKDPERGSTEEIFNDASFDPQVVLNSDEAEDTSIRSRMNFGAKAFINTIKNPKAVSRNNYARQAAAKIAYHPHNVTSAFDRELLDAYDALDPIQNEQVRSLQRDGELPEEKETTQALTDAQTRVTRIMEQREDLESGWILGRHVVRARAIHRMAIKPSSINFRSMSSSSIGDQQVSKGGYFGDLAMRYTDSIVTHRVDDFDELPFDLSELGLAVERLAAVSTPWQSFFWKIRQVYRWEQPQRTFGYMLTYWVLWYMHHIMTFAVGYMIFVTIRYKTTPSTIEAVRERVQRSEQQAGQVRAWGELVQKYGSNDWIEPLVDGIGPHIQMQTGDLSSLLERLEHLYSWESPRQTTLVLLLLLSIFLFLLLGSTEHCVQVLWFGAGCAFFYSFPVISRYPRYRHVARFWFWFLWEVPDAAESSIDRLQRKVSERDRRRAMMLKSEEEAVRNARTSPSIADTSGMPVKSATGHAETEQLLGSFADILLRVRASDHLKFEAIVLPSHKKSFVILTRSHITIDSDIHGSRSYEYKFLVEMEKFDFSASSRKSSSMRDKDKLSRSSHLTRWLERATSVQLSPDGLEFVFSQKPPAYNVLSSNFTSHNGDAPRQQASEYSEHDETNTSESRTLEKPISHEPRSVISEETQQHSPELAQKEEIRFTLILNKSERDKIFTVILAWSGLKWQPLFSKNRQQKLGSRRVKDLESGNATKAADLNTNLDDAIKRGLS